MWTFCKTCWALSGPLRLSHTSKVGNKGYDFFEKDKDKDNILVNNILGILLEDIFRQLILQRIRIKDSLRIFKDKDKDKDFWAIWEVYAGSNFEFWINSSNHCFSLLTSTSVI